ncbi:matrixin family metalloprotease [Nitrosopumilus sp. S6]
MSNTEDGPLDQLRQISDDEDIVSNRLGKIEEGINTLRKEQLVFQNIISKRFIVIVSVIILIVIMTFYLNYAEQDIIKTAILENKHESRMGYVIENLRGDTIDTWAHWNNVNNDIFHIHVENSPSATEHRMSLLQNVVMSEESLHIDDKLLHKGTGTSNYFLGWYGALNSIKDVTKYPIPSNIHFHRSLAGEGDIIIKLTNQKNGDGFTGFTRLIVEDEHQIIKATITIYEIDKLSDESLKTILRHELGHAYGLSHSTAPEDLMYPVISTNYPYISNCILDAITSLYDGNPKSQVTCEN